MSQARTVRLTALAIVIVYSAALALSGVAPAPHLKQALSYLPTAAGVLTLVFERWAWRWLGVNRFLGRPYLAGTWHVTIEPSAQSHIPEQKRGARHTFMIVQQTLWTVHITQLSAESRSESSTAALRKVGGGDQRRLSFLYDNAPQQKFRTGSPRHEGACSLNIAGHRPTLMDGSYFTDRFTCGDMRLVKVADRAAALPYDELRRSFAESIDSVASPS